ncbi:MAG: hypothetical protein Fur0018_07120 [Anaerolineales bacterium]
MGGLLLLGALLRLMDSTDPPLDFHPTRQLRNAIVARGLYYRMLPESPQRETALKQMHTVGQYEPPIVETLAALGYRLTGGVNWVVPRLLTTLFWLIGGLALFDLARRAVNVDGALVSLAFYLVLPFSVQASRSFQPDPGMTMWIVLCAWALYRWGEQPRWKWAVGAGLFGGMAALTKIVAAYIVGGAAIGVVLLTLGPKKLIRHPQVWSMAGLMVFPSFVYYLFGNPGGASEYFVNWTLKLLHLIANPAFYVRWMSFLHTLFGLTPLFLALLGVLLAQGRLRALLLGLWGGYFVYGLTLPYQMYTHSYYHLQLVPIVALSLVPVAQRLFRALVEQPRIWQYAGIALMLLALAYPSWVARSTLLAEDFRAEPAYWQEVAAAIPENGAIVALTQDYGYRLMYFGERKVKLWPSVGEQNLATLRGKSTDFAERFQRFTVGQDYFVVTAMGQWKWQPELQQYLTETYSLIAEGDGYLIFDLRHLRTP